MTKGVLYFIACAAGPAQYVDQGVRQAQAAGWDVCQPRLPMLTELTGHPVRSQYKLPWEKDALPKATAMLVAPLTTTSACKWAAGITDDVALGLPAEGVHLGVPVVVLPFWSTALGAQPAVGRAVETLREQEAAAASFGGMQGWPRSAEAPSRHHEPPPPGSEAADSMGRCVPVDW